MLSVLVGLKKIVAPSIQRYHPSILIDLGATVGLQIVELCHRRGLMLDSDDDLCWSRALNAVDPCCSYPFQSSSGPMKNKFCKHCRTHGLRLPASRLMVLTSQTSKEFLKNSHGHGLWVRARTADGSLVRYRIVNNNQKVSGAGQFPVIIFSEEPPQDLELVFMRDGVSLAPELSPVPEVWVTGGCVQLAVTYATLTPVLNMKVHIRKRRSEISSQDDASCRLVTNSAAIESSVIIQPHAIDRLQHHTNWAASALQRPIAPATPICGQHYANWAESALQRPIAPATPICGSCQWVTSSVANESSVTFQGRAIDHLQHCSDGIPMRTAESLGNALRTTSALAHGSAFRPVAHFKRFKSAEWDGELRESSVLTPSPAFSVYVGER